MPTPPRPEIAANKLFRGVPPDVLAEIARVPRTVAFAAGETLFEEDAAADFLYLVISGSVRVSKLGRSGAQETLSYFEPGDFFGEMGLLDLGPRSARAVAARPTVVGRVDREGFERLLRLAPGPVASNLTRGVVTRLRNANTHFIAELTRAERLSVIGSMAAAIAHDFKNPMSAILMAADLIAETASDDDQRESASAIRQAVDQMVVMTQELLDFARGISDLRLQTVATGELLAELDGQILDRMARQGITVERTVDYRGELVADRRRLLRVLVNLVKNAGEAMHEGGTLRVGVERRDGHVAFTVADTGVGIPPDVLPTVFEPFVTHGKVGGTGLGMSIVRTVVEAHHGRVSLASTPGQGTTVEVLIPVEPPPA